jgi:hypothetical protein
MSEARETRATRSFTSKIEGKDSQVTTPDPADPPPTDDNDDDEDKEETDA